MGRLAGDLDLVIAAVATALALLLARGRARLEPVVAIGVLAGRRPDGPVGHGHRHLAGRPRGLGARRGRRGTGWLVALAVALVALGTLHNDPALTAIAMAALVVFTTFQSFAVFAAIIQGAWLFVVLGLVFLGTGFLFDRARRGISANLEGADS